MFVYPYILWYINYTYALVWEQHRDLRALEASFLCRLIPRKAAINLIHPGSFFAIENLFLLLILSLPLDNAKIIIVINYRRKSLWFRTIFPPCVSSFDTYRRVLHRVPLNITNAYGATNNLFPISLRRNNWNPWIFHLR